jgi:cytochrome c-550 PedF
MGRKTRTVTLAAALALVAWGAAAAVDETPKPLDTPGLKPLGSEWLKTNPYRGDPLAVKIGEQGFDLDCARCHGKGADGGVAGMEKVPNLRLMDKDEAGDALYLSHTRNGYVESGVVKAPAFEGVLSQEAMWAIRSYLDSRYDGD